MPFFMRPAIVTRRRGYDANAVRFNGTPWLTRGSDLTNNSNGTDGTFSIYVNFMGGDGVRQYIGNSEGDRWNCYKESNNKIYFNWFNGASFDRQLISSNTYTTASGWIHIYSSWQSNTAHLYINGSQDEGTNSANANTIDYTRTEWAIGANDAGGNRLNAEVADLWLSLSQYWAPGTGISKFRDAQGKPVDLGADGSGPGVTPILFLSGETASWHTNKGPGEGLTVNSGPLSDAASTPSD